MPITELACGTCYDLRGFGGSREGIENERPKELRALRGRIFEILRGFLRGLIFDDFFLICKISPENPGNL